LIKKYLFIGLGSLFVCLGFIGIIIPGIPTTPFLLLSAWFFSKSSSFLENWLINHKLFGPLIRDWNKHKSISRKSKIVAVIIIIPTFAFSIYSSLNMIIDILLGITCISLCAFLISRPEPPIEQRQ
tara:strand:- start:26 stop:403 length:378 start_codon:yes stop_codon:yes gene_type:complete